MGPNPDSPELRAVAPIVALDPQPRLVGPATLVTNGGKIIAFTSAEMMRGELAPQLYVLPRFDGGAVPIARWSAGFSGIGLCEIDEPLPADADVQPLPIAGVSASVETRGAPAALVTVAAASPGWTRVVIPVHVDVVRSGDEIITRVATPIAPGPPQLVDGASLFAWFPPDPVLGRPPEVLVLALGYACRQQAFKPRGVPALVELVGLDDLGRVLWSTPEPQVQPSELAQVAGELPDRRPKTSPPVDPLEDIRRRRS